MNELSESFSNMNVDIENEIKVGLTLLNKDSDSEIMNLKPKQLEAMKKAKNSDCFVALKTGYGKSLIFQLIPYVWHSIVIIVCPLDVIIEQCMARFKGAIKIEDSFLFMWGAYLKLL